MGLKYEPALDGLRAIAIVGVLGYHAQVPALGGGLRGVDTFFVLSGYLITSILLGSQVSDREFYARRAWRLYPALLTMLAAYSIFWSGSPWKIAAAAFYLYDFVAPFELRPTPIMPTWSLAVEAQFYLVWPLVVRKVAHLAKPAQTLFIAWILFSVFRSWVMLEFPRLAYFSILHCSGLILGAAIAVKRPVLKAAWLWAALLSLIYIFGTLGNDVIWEPATEIVSALLIAALMQPSWLKDMLSSKPLVIIGVLSYGIYLWHYPIYTLTAGDWPERAAVTAAVSVVIALASYLTVEKLRFLSKRATGGAGDR